MWVNGGEKEKDVWEMLNGGGNDSMDHYGSRLINTTSVTAHLKKKIGRLEKAHNNHARKKCK